MCEISEEGYVIFREDKTGIWIRELVALNVEQMHKLIDILEQNKKASSMIGRFWILDFWKSIGPAVT